MPLFLSQLDMMNTKGKVIKLFQRKVNLGTTKWSCIWHLCKHSLNKYRLNTCSEPVTMLGSRTQKRRSTVPATGGHFQADSKERKQEDENSKTTMAARATTGWEFLKILKSLKLTCLSDSFSETPNRAFTWGKSLAQITWKSRGPSWAVMNPAGFHWSAFWSVISQWAFALCPVFVCLCT